VCCGIAVGFCLRRNVQHGAVATLKLHVTDLSFTKVLKDAVRPVTIRIAVLKPLFTSDNNYYGVIRWRNNSTLLLAAKSRVDIGSAVVNPANLKTPGHDDANPL
jgi:hypothetical protein